MVRKVGAGSYSVSQIRNQGNLANQGPDAGPLTAQIMGPNRLLNEGFDPWIEQAEGTALVAQPGRVLEHGAHSRCRAAGSRGPAPDCGSA